MGPTVGTAGVPDSDQDSDGEAIPEDLLRPRGLGLRKCESVHNDIVGDAAQATPAPTPASSWSAGDVRRREA